MFKTNVQSETLEIGLNDIICIIVGIVVLLILDSFTYRKVDIYAKIKKFPVILRWLSYIAVIFTIILFSAGEAQEFLYFKF